VSEVKPIPITDIADFESVDIVEVLVKAGDEVAIDQPIVTVESEKAMMDYPSPYAGVVENVLVNEGAKIIEGDILITIVTNAISSDSMKSSNNGKSAAQPQHEKKIPKVIIENPISNPSSAGLSTETGSFKKVSAAKSSNAYASPSAQKYARQLGVDLGQVEGTGRKQRIVEQDIQQHVRKQLQNTTTGNLVNAKPLNFSNYGTSKSEKLTKIQKLTANNMLNAWQSIPHVTHFDQADVTQMEIHRKKLSANLNETQIKLTPLAFVAKALVATLKQFPQFNASLDTFSEELIYKNFYHIGIAVDTPHGLFVPVLRDVDKKALQQVAVELVEISDLARQRKLSPKHMGGASMTISSLGNLGGQFFTPIINPPEVAILGLSKMVIKEKTTASSVVQQKLLPLSLSYDHRVINGADAAKFCTQLKSVLEDVWRLIL